MQNKHRENLLMLAVVLVVTSPLVAMIVIHRVKYRTERVRATESATVVDLVFVPSGHGSGLGLGTGSSSSGEAVTTVTVINVDVPARYGAVFQCQHGKFVSEGQDERHKDLWMKLREGQRVTVVYDEVFLVTRKTGARQLKALDFIDAEPMQ